MRKAFISEIFPTIQGEGPYTGLKQVFLRLAGCPLRCDYCDTPDSLTVNGHAEMSSEETAEEVVQISQKEKIDWVSITGGEPLAHVEFLKEVIPLLRNAGLKIYLETAGVHPEALAGIIELCDVVSMDIKLPSATGRSFWGEHRKFLQIGGQKIITKVVLESHSEPHEIEKMISVVSESPDPPTLVLQLVSPYGPAVKPPTPEQVAHAFKLAKAKIPHVLVMNQKHKEWGIR